MNKQVGIRPQSHHKENKTRNGGGTAVVPGKGTSLDGVVKEGFLEEGMARWTPE